MNENENWNIFTIDLFTCVPSSLLLPVFSSTRRHIGITSAIKGCGEGVRKTTMRGTSLRATSPADEKRIEFKRFHRSHREAFYHGPARGKKKEKKEKKKSITCGIVVGSFKKPCLLQSRFRNIVPLRR